MKRIMQTMIGLGVAALVSAPGSVHAEGKRADNTGMNARDDALAKPTADQQASGTRRDVELTRLIRRELTKDSSLSTYAQNVKIVTLDGKVTLRGPVRSDAERAKVASIAGKVVGSSAAVANEIEIAK
mgnify:CR=1 FL=1